jgi:hypothetical protein
MSKFWQASEEETPEPSLVGLGGFTKYKGRGAVQAKRTT